MALCEHNHSAVAGPHRRMKGRDQASGVLRFARLVRKRAMVQLQCEQRFLCERGVWLLPCCEVDRFWICDRCPAEHSGV